jgi:folate-dependent phosphoribosylglycinamide formyltransferase PurN
MNDIRIVFVAFSENSLGRRIIKGLVDNGNKPISTFMASELAFKAFRKNGFKRYYKNNGVLNTIWRVYYRLTLRRDVKKSSLNLDQKLNQSIKEVCNVNDIPIDYFDNINETKFVEKMALLKPDLIVLGGAPLIKKQVIELPKIAVLNSHPGVLPQAKGMDVVAQSIIDNVPLGVTVFKVDEGIDSGPILLKKYLEKDTSRLKLHEIEALVEELSANAMLESIELIKSGNYEFVPQTEKGNIYKALNYKKYKLVRNLLDKKS